MLTKACVESPLTHLLVKNDCHGSCTLFGFSKFSFCQYPFILSLAAKRYIMQKDSESQMIVMARVSEHFSIWNTFSMHLWLIACSPDFVIRLCSSYFCCQEIHSSVTLALFWVTIEWCVHVHDFKHYYLKECLSLYFIGIHFMDPDNQRKLIGKSPITFLAILV